MTTSLVIAWLAMVVTSGAVDLLAAPGAAPWRLRAFASVVMHVSTLTWLFALFLVLWGRTWISALSAVGLIALLVVVNNAKYKALREPVVFSDLALFAQSIKHPRLYFPYLSWLQVVAVVPAVALFAAVYGLDSEVHKNLRVYGLVTWVVLGGFQIWLAMRMQSTLNPAHDQAKHGFFCTFASYLIQGMSAREIRHVQQQFKASPYLPASSTIGGKVRQSSIDLPDVVIVQSESFFDIRKTGLHTNPLVLQHYDTLRRNALASGELVVPAWGANTMRTEFAFLSGIPNASLRFGSFYPYAYVWDTTPALPRAFGAMGYRCTAVHPHPADFFMRHKVFPRLGFHSFEDEAQFSDSPRDGPYVSDQAVTDWLIKQLEQSIEQPQLLFAITMENHGPLHLEKACPTEENVLYLPSKEQVIDELNIYLRHLSNANQMLGRLQAYLAQRQRKTLLCFYGDHVPSMGNVYQALGVNPSLSDYILWANYEATGGHRSARKVQSLTPEQLGMKLVRVVGLI